MGNAKDRGGGGGVFENIKVFLKNQKHEANIVEGTDNEASLKFVQSSIQPDGQFIHPVIHLFTALHAFVGS